MFTLSDIGLSRRGFLSMAVPFTSITIAGCTPAYINTADLGARSTGAEITAHLSGKSVRFASSSDGPVDVESYYGTDGVFKSVALKDPWFVIGTWGIHRSLGTDRLAVQGDAYWIDTTGVERNSFQATFVYYIQPDGTAKMDEIGGGNYS